MQVGPSEAGSRDRASKGAEAAAVHAQVQKFLRFVVNETSEEMSEITAANKKRVCEEILSDVDESLGQQDPVLAARRRLTNYATLNARDTVLSKAPGKGEFEGITGGLRARLPDLASVDPGLREFFARDASKATTAERMAELLRARAILFSLWMRAYNVVRIDLGDWDNDKRRDWFGAFWIAQALCSEYGYRRELDMPSNIAPAESRSGIPKEVMAYCEFESIILGGHASPRPAWEEKWATLLKFPCPLAGLEF
jgi:hypothetical protein